MDTALWKIKSRRENKQKKSSDEQPSEPGFKKLSIGR